MNMASSRKGSINEEEHWEEAARQEQAQFADFLKTMDMCTLSVLRNRLAAALFGIPEKLQNNYENLSYEYYNRKQRKIVEKIATCILKNQTNPNEQKILFSFVLIVGRLERTNDKNFEDWVFRLPGNNLRSKIFVDRDCRVYQNWKDYLTENRLPKAKICHPVNGEYTFKKGKLEVEFTATPACSVGKKVLFGFDVTSAAVGIAAGAVTTTCLFVPVSAPVVWTALAATVVSGSYGAGRSIEHLVDRGKHGQTLSILDSQARSAWLGAAVPFFGMAAGGASVFAVRAPAAGLGVAQVARTVANVTNGVNCFAHGACFVHDIYGIIECKQYDCDITSTQIFQCIASVLLFANAVISTHQARMLLKTIPVENGKGGIENPFMKLGQLTCEENGLNVRPTNFAINTNISQAISMVVTWGKLLLSIPPEICDSIHDIIQFVMKSMQKNDTTFVVFISGLLPLLKILWEQVCFSVQNQPVFDQCNEKYEPMNEKYERYNFMKKSSEDNDFKCKTSFNSKDTTMSNTKDQQSDSFSGKINFESIKLDEKQENGNEITILDTEIAEKMAEIQEIILKITETGSILDIWQITHFFFERLKEDVIEKEKEFQSTLKRIPDMSEESLENIYGIKGNRNQFFANEIMKSYRDFKLLVVKQDYNKLLEQKGMQLPLYCPPESDIQIQLYTSTQKNGTRKDKYVNILKQAGIVFDHSSSIFYYCENAFFVEFEDPNSKYVMVGIVNFAEDNKMSGIIVLKQRTQ